MRRLFLLACGAVALVTVLPHCDTTCAAGDPCSESEVGFACPSKDPCVTLICDGAQYSPSPKVAGNACSIAGSTCPAPYPATSSGCNAEMLVCNGVQLVLTPTENVGPGNTCNTSGLVCHHPGTECESCTCNGTQWVCNPQCCQPQCFDAGGCPTPDSVVAGAPCTTSTLICSTYNACGEASTVSGACTCPAGVWTCAAVVTCDAGGD